MNFADHESSKIVYLRRLPLSIVEASANNSKTPEIKNYFDQAHRALGSCWVQGSMRPHTGLTLPEENLLMPLVLDIPTTDKDFRIQSTNFFHNITTKVLPLDANGNGGTALQIGLEDNSKPLSKDNLPLVPSDYIRYMHAKTHRNVAPNVEEAVGNPLKHYYIFDPAKVTDTNKKANSLEDDALAIYFTIKEDDNLVKQYLTLMGIDVYRNLGREVITLRAELLKNPSMFLKIHKNPNREASYMLKELHDFNLLEVLGGRYIVKSTQDQIGATLAEAISYIKDPTKSKEVALLKGELQQAKANRK